MRRPFAFTIVTAILFFVACASCGSCAPAPERVVAPAPAAVVAPRTELRAGTSGEYPPLSLWKKDGDPVLGFAPALIASFVAHDAAHLAGVRWTRFTWPALVDDFRASRFDLAADGITVRPERSILGRFTVPIARGGAVLLLRRPAWAQAGTALAGLDRPELRVVVNRGGHLERVARALLHSASITSIPDNAGVQQALARGEADAAMTNTFEAPGWAAGVPGVEMLGPLTDDVTAIWVRPEQSELADRLDAWILEEEESGRLASLREQSLGPGGGPRAALPVSALLAATSERLALMPFVAAAKVRAGKAVEDAAQESTVIAASTAAVAKAAAARSRATAAPPNDAVEAFFRAQIEAAKGVQRRVALPMNAPAFRLEQDLRPAIARISARMAMLAVRVPRGTTRESVLAEARTELATASLEPAEIDRLATTLAALALP